ncbi:FKBP-type peptidyl-prolyl cis-trans isomerase [Sunxiuqinia sp. A32]|uniref:FKBP-type peptidyl-prolyl cis-trans isomerase n=1 Tax=Sunxiuqinia sp. A32 TaxID=3461496 RepID=UPI004045710F
MIRLVTSIKFAAVVGLVLGLASCLDKENPNEVTYSPENEAELIDEYIDTMVNRGYDIDTTEVGVFIMELEMGEGATVQVGDSIGVNYIGYFLTGGVFDASTEPYKFTYGVANHVTGFDDAISLLNVGAKGAFLLPSSLAYGSSGFYSIPPYTPLIFEIELVDIYNSQPAN